MSSDDEAGWGIRYLCLYYSCPGRDNAAQSYHHQGRRRWSWLSVYTPCIWGWCSMLISCPDTIHTWAIWRVCAVQLSVGLRGHEVQAWYHLGASTLVGNQVEVKLVTGIQDLTMLTHHRGHRWRKETHAPLYMRLAIPDTGPKFCVTIVKCVCCLVLLTWYWGIVAVPGSFLFRAPGVAGSSPFTLNYVAGYTGPLLFLFERTHN